MRRYPCSWNTILAKLGFRRRKVNHRHTGRRACFEPLEHRNLLAVDDPILLVTTPLDVSADDGLMSLREAIYAADHDNQNDVDLIEFSDEVKAEGEIRLSGQLVLHTSMNIIGPGADRLAIDAQGASRVFVVWGTTAEVTISGLTITGGNAGNEGGGGIYNRGRLTLDSVAVVGNRADTTGGGVVNDLGGTLHIKNSTFDDNTATGATGEGTGGAIGLYFSVPNSLTIENSSFTNNTAKNAGAVRISSSAAGTTPVASIRNSTFSGNSAAYGGAVQIHTSPEATAPIEFINTTITKNKATTSSGGGVNVWNPGGAAVLFHNTIVAGNEAPAFPAYRDFVGNVSSASSHNLVGQGYTGLGIVNGDQQDNQVGVDPKLGELGRHGGSTAVYSLLADSPALDAGSNAYAAAYDQRGYNRAVDRRGASSALVDIGAYERGLIVSTAADPASWSYADDELSLREALAIATVVPGLNEIEFSDEVVAAGEILLSDQLWLHSSVNIIGPGADRLAIDAQEASRVFAVWGTTAEVTISGLTITGGDAGNEGGGGIYNRGRLTLDSVAVVGNTADTSGGGVVNDLGGTLRVLNSTFDHNHATGATGEGTGGAIGLYFSVPNSLTIENSSFTNNTAKNAGAVRISSSASGTTPVASIRNSTFSENSAVYGGAVQIHTSAWADAPIEFINTTITKNKATTSSGGGVSVWNPGGAAVLFHNTIVAGNETPNFPYYRDFVGTISSDSSHNLVGLGYVGLGISDGDAMSNQVGFGTPIDPLLAPLGDYGGRTKTHALLSGSRAINAGGDQSAGGLTSDQRGAGYDRKFGAAVDIGAYELQQPFSLNSDHDVIFVVGEGPVAIAPDANLEGFVDSIVVRLADRPDSFNEKLSAFPSNPAISAVYRGGVLTLAGSATIADYRQAIRSVTYENASITPDTTNRTVSIEVRQGATIVGLADLTIDPRIRAEISLRASLDFAVYSRLGIYDDGLAEYLAVGSSTGDSRDNTAYLQFAIPTSVQSAYLDDVELLLSTLTFFDYQTSRFVLPYESQKIAVYSLEDLPPVGTSSQIAQQLHEWINLSSNSPVAILQTQANSRFRADLTSAVAAAASASESFLSLGLIDEDNDPLKSFWTFLAGSNASIAALRPELRVSGLFKSVIPAAEPDVYDSSAYVPMIVPIDEGVLSNDLTTSDLPLIANVVRQPQAGYLQLNEDGSFSYTPDATSTATKVSFTYRAFNGLAYSDETSVTINLEAAKTLQIEPQLAWVRSPNGQGQDAFFDSDGVLQTNPRYFPVGWYEGLLRNESSFQSLQTVYREYNYCPPIITYGPGWWLWQCDPNDFDPGSASIIRPGEWWFKESDDPDLPEDYLDLPLDYLGIPRTTSYLQFDLLPNNQTNVDPTSVEIESAYIVYQTTTTDLSPYSTYTDGANTWPLNLTPAAQQSLEEDARFRIQPENGAELPPSQFQVAIPNAGGNSTYRGGFYPNAYEQLDFTAQAQQIVAAAVTTGVPVNELLTTVRFDGLNLAAGSISNVHLVVTFAEPPDAPDSNAAPVFTSDRIAEAIVGQQYRYVSTASDDDNDRLSFRLDPAIEWPPGYQPLTDHRFQFVDEGPGQSNPATYDRGVTTWSPSADLIGSKVTIIEIVEDEAGNVTSRPIEILVKADPANRPPVILNEAPDSFGIFNILDPQELGPDLDVTTSTALGTIDGQTWLDFNGDGERLGNFGGFLDIQLATDGELVITGDDDNEINMLGEVAFAGKDAHGKLIPFVLELFTELDVNGQPLAQNWSSFFINTNGNITFTGNDWTFTPDGLSSEDTEFLPRIAPFWADVDTRSAGAVYLARGVSPRGNPFIQVDWRDVGYYISAAAGSTDELNDFTLYIEDDADGDIVAFIYRNMEWTTGDASYGVDGYGGDGAEVGFSAGNGVNYLRFGVADGQIVENGPAPISEATLLPFSGTDETPVILVFRIGGDGQVRQFSEPGADGFVVDLIDVATQAVADSQLSRSADVNGDGHLDRQTEMGVYRFVDVPAGEYEVRVRPRGGWQQTFPANSGNALVSIDASDVVFVETGHARLYSHVVEAVDVDGDELTYSLIDSPSDAHIDPVTGGLTWLPRKVGDYSFTVHVEDDGELFDEQTVVVKVRNVTTNVLPVVTSIPPAAVRAGSVFSYRIKAYDANVDALLFEKVSGPEGLTVSGDGLVRWDTTEGEVDDHPVVVRIIDAAGVQEAVTTSFSVKVVPPLQNDPPVVLSSAPTKVVVGQRYFYQIVGEDPEGDSLGYSLIDGPQGMRLQGAFGYVDWTPSDNQIGIHDVTVRVRDLHNKSVPHTFTVEVVRPNVAPAILSKPPGAGSDSPFVYRLTADDLDGDPIFWAAPDRPSGMELLYDVDGAYLAWPSPTQGSHVVTLLASDGHGGVDVQQFALEVGSVAPPSITGNSRTSIPVGEAYSSGFSVTSATRLTNWNSTAPATRQIYLDENSRARGMALDFDDATVTGGAGGEPWVYNGIRIVWTPQATDVFQVSVTAVNDGGAPSTATFALTVTPQVNVTAPPVVTNNPLGPAIVGVGWTYLLALDDPDGNHQTVDLEVLTKPASAVYSADTRTFSWIPTTTDPGTFRFKLTDDDDDYSIWEFELPVSPTGTPSAAAIVLKSEAPARNEGPEFLTKSLGSRAIDQELRVQLNVNDPNGHQIVGFAVDATQTTAAGFTDANIDDAGLVVWTPSQAGEFTIAVIATDEKGTSTTCVFTILVSDNAAPTLKVLGAGIPSALVGAFYSVDFEIDDPNPDDVPQATLNAAAKDLGISLNRVPETSTWTLAWNAPAATGQVPVEITVDDLRGGVRKVSFPLTVLATEDGNPPDVVSTPPASITIPAERLFSLDLVAADASGGQPRFSWNSAFTPPGNISLTSSGRLRWEPTFVQISPSGTHHPLRIDVKDAANNTTTLSINVTVVDPEAYLPLVPRIDSVPPNAATANQALVYDPQVDYAGNLPLRWMKLEGPEGLSVDPRTGRITWTPSTTDLGEQPFVRFRVVDAVNFGSEQSFTLSVRGTNQQPTLKSSLPSEWKAGLPFDAKVDVVDPEGHALRFSELEPIPQGDPLPAGLVIGPDGRLTWPAPIEGEISFVVRATETHDPSSSFEATFKLTVLPATANLAPMVKAAPARSCATWTDGGYENRYTIVVTDPDASSGLLDFQIVGGASGDMAIIPGSTPGEAIVTWTPTQAELGTHQITVQATDFGGAGKPVYRSFILEALKNELPAIPADQVATVAVGDRLVHRVPASDPEQGGLKFAIDVSALNDSATLVAAGLSIDSITGQLLWAVPAHAALIGDYVVTVMATDALGAATKQEVQVKVTSDDVAPTIRLLMIDPATDAPVANGGKLIRNNQPGSNDDYQLSIRLTDNFGLGALNPQEHKLTVTPASGAPFQVPLPAFRSDFGLEALEVGPMTLEVTATDAAGIERVETYRFFIIDAASDAVAMIASPAGAEPVTTITKIYGSVDQDGSDAGTSTSYYIDVIDARIGEVVGRIADTTVASEVANGELATLDPTLFPDGTYRIRLAVVDSGGAILAIDEQRVEIVNSIKLGELDVAFTDLSVKLGGIPVTLSRSYDSKRAEEVGDFGYGWNLDFLDGAVVVDHPEGYASSLTQPTPIGTRILVTLADGSTHGFTFQMSGGGLFGGGKPVFTPDAGVTSRLSLSELQPHLSLELSWGHSDGTVKDNDGDAFVPAWWARDLQLSTRGGLNYHYSFETGKLVGLSDSNGNRIVIGPATDASGDPQTQVIETESGSQKILIHRDATTGLITEIVDPNQASIHYRYGVYDPVADEFSTDAELSSPTHQLGEVENRVAAKTHYLYDQIVTSGGESLDNMLVGVIDGDRPILTAGYNSEGRLNLLQDAAGGGADVEFDLNLGDGRSVERIKDSEGNFIDLVRDERGNVVMRVIPLDAPGAQPDPALRAFLVTESVFNENGNLLRESVPYRVVGAEQRYQVPAPLPETHPEAWARRLKYDDFNRLTHSTDALDNVTVTRYDDQDRVIASIDANGVINHSVYDERTGDLLERYSTQGESGAAFNRTRYSYENGRLVESHQVAADGTVNLVSTTAYFDSGDHLGLAKSTTDAAGVTRYFGYDDNGNQTHSWHVWTNPLPPSQSITLVTVSQYDGEGRAQATFEYELNAAYVEFFALKTALVGATSKSSTSTAYDSQGRVILATDRLGAVSHTLYDARGSVIESRSTAKNENNVSGWLVSRTLYDAQGQVVFAADPYFVTAAAYSATGVPTRGTHTVYDHLGRTTASRRYAGVQIDVDSSGTAPTTVTSFDFDVSPPLSVTSTHYDSLGRVEYTISESGARTDYYYDATGRQIAVLAPAVMIGGQTVRHLSESMFDPAGRLVQSKSNIAITASADAHPLIYDATFDPSLRDDSARQTAYYEYDPAGRQTAVITSAIDNPDTGSPQQSQFDIDHPRIHLRTETAYDDFGRRIVSIEGIKQAAPSDPDTINRGRQLATNYEYDQSGNLTAVVLPSIEHPDQPIGEVRPRYEYDYDDYGNRISIRDNVYQIGENIYYDHGGAANDFTAAYDTRLTEFDYDHRGRQVSRQLPEGVAAGNASFTERMVFSDTPLGSLGATPQASVGLGQLKYAVDFEGRVTAYFYDNTAAGGGRLVRKDYFESETLYNGGAVVDRVSYVYDAFGRTLTTTQQFALNDPPNARTRVTTNVYDAESRLTRITTPEGTINHEYHPVTGLPTRTYTGATSDAAYTSVQGDLKAITDTRYAYDKLGRLLHVVSVERFDTPLAGTSAPTSTVDWVDFNGNGVFAGNERVTGEVTSYAYDVVGNLSRISLPNNVTVDHEYDELNRLVRMINYVDASTGGVQDEFDAADLLRSSFEYELDVHHKRTSAVEKINHGNANNTTVVETHIDWVYDNLGRLASEDYDHDVSVTGGVDFLAEYAFDLVGNRLSKTVDNRAAAGVDEAFAYDYDRNDRLYRERQDANVATAPGYDTTTFYQYDSPNGAGGTMDGTVRTAETKYAGERTAPGTTKLSETTFQYDLRGRMKASSVDADGSQSNPAVGSEYAYNDAGIRISQKVGGVTTHYVVDDNNPTGYAQVLEEKRDVNQDGTIQDAEVTKSYIIGHDVIAQAAQAAAAMFLMTDGHGSTRALLDKMAAIVENAAANNQKQLFSYDAYGNLIVAPALVQQVQSALTSLLYSGEQTDMATGLQYLRARYYSAGTGTFNQFDAFNGITADPQSLHKYTYTEADPINGLDPTGQLGIFAAFVALSVFSLLFELVAGFALNYSSDILINSDPIYSDPINSTGLWSGGIGGVSASYGFSGGEVKAGTVWSFENSSQSVGIAYLGGSLGLGVGFSGGGAAVFIFNAPSVRNIPKALSVNLDVRVDAIGGLSSMLKRLFGAAFTARELSRISNGLAKTHEIAAVAEGIQDVLDISNFEPTYVTIPIDFGIQAFIGAQFGTFAVTDANL